MSLGLFFDSGNLDLLKKVRNFLSQKELAARLHYTPRQIARWEKGESPLPHALLPALREILQIEEQKDCDFTFRGCPACFLILKGVVISSHETNRFS